MKIFKYLTLAVALIALSSCISMTIGGVSVTDPGPVNEVNLDGWKKLKKSMPKDEVEALLGKPGMIVSSGKGENLKEYWEYNWSEGLSLFSNESDKAYVVYFDSNGRLLKWRKPIKYSD